MFAGGSPPRTAVCGAACGAGPWTWVVPPWAPRAPPGPAPRRGGGPSGTTTAPVTVASARLRLVRLSHGNAEELIARSRNALPIIGPPRARTSKGSVEGGPHRITLDE